MTYTVHLFNGDSLELLSGCFPHDILAVVTDPPYGISLRRLDWDKPPEDDDEDPDAGREEGFDPIKYQTWCETWLAPCYEKLPEGGLIKVFSSPRTHHRLLTAMCKIGFQTEIVEGWIRSRTMPRGQNMKFAFEKLAEAETRKREKQKLLKAAEHWGGFSTALKTSWEPIVVGRKPL